MIQNAKSDATIDLFYPPGSAEACGPRSGDHKLMVFDRKPTVQQTKPSETTLCRPDVNIGFGANIDTGRGRSMSPCERNDKPALGRLTIGRAT